MDVVSYILSTTFTKKSLEGMGALKGAPCTISSIVDNPDGTHDITFSWKDNSDVTHTSILTVANGETPTITSTEIEGGHTITFATTDPSQSVSFNVMDGEEGQRGVSVIRADVDNNNYLKLELSDGNIINAGQIKTVSMVDNTLSLESANPVENRVITSALNNKVNKVSGKQLSTEDFTTAEKNKLANIENGAQVNTLENLIINGEEATIVDKKIALNIITSAVSNLQNYYLKSETYTKTEVEELIGSTVGVTIEIVQELPTVGQTNVIYFVPTETANVYSQYIYTSADGWVLIGSTSVDLSNYYTKGQVDTLLNGKQNVLTIDAFPTSMSNNPVASGGVYSAIAQMQPQFQFTNMPVASESNYGFVYQYVGNAGTYEPNMFYRCVYNTYAGEYRWEEVIFHATVTVDSELSSSSTNPVQNRVVKAALDAKQDIMQFSTMPSAQDNLGKIVQYTGATTATYQNACFYKAVYDSEHDTYIWTMVKFSADISVDNVLSDVSENPVQNKVITKKFDEYETSFTGTQDEWNSLTTEQQNTYDIYHIIDDGNVLNLGVYLEKKTAMPVASEDVENKIYLYTGTTTQDFKKGVVYQCVSDGQVVPTYSWVALIDFGTAAIKNSTDRVSPNNTDLVESQSVYSAINTALSSIYTPRGDITCAELTSALLISDNIGNVYETSDSGTTTSLFLQGAGHPIATGSNVGIINAGEGRILFNLMANAFDLTSYQKKDLTSAVEGQTTVEGALGALSTDKADKVVSATNGDLASLDANGNLVDSGVKKTEVNALIPKQIKLNNTTTNIWAVFSTTQLGQNYIVSTYFGGYCSTIILERFNSYIIRSSDTNAQPQLQVQEVTWSADGTKFALKIPYASPNIAFTPIGGNSIIEQPTYIGSMTEANMLTELGLTNYTNYLKKLVTDDSGLCAHGNNEPFMSGQPIRDYLLGLDGSIKFATFTVDPTASTVTDKISTTEYFSYNCYKQGGSWRIVAINSSGNKMYIGDVSSSTQGITWEQVATNSDIIAKVETTSTLDANNCTETGYYTNVNVNQPISGYGFTMFVETSSNNSYCHQTAHLNIADDSPSITYVRKGRYLNDAWVWSDWKKLVTESDLIVSANGNNSTATGTNVSSTWRITSNGSSCICYGINTEVFNAAAVSMTSMQLPSGYVYDGIISADVFVDGDTAWAAGASHQSGNGAGTYVTRSGVVNPGSFRQIVLAHKA